MKKTIFTIVLGLLSFVLFAQNNDLLQLQNRITALENANAKLTTQIHANQKVITDLTNQLKASSDNLTQLQGALLKSQTRLDEIVGVMDQRIVKSEQTSAQQFDQLGKLLSKNTIYWIAAFLAVGLVSYYLYRRLRGRLSNEKAAIYKEIKAGNEQLKFDLSALITKNADDIKYMYSGEMMDFSEKNKRSLDDLRSEIEARFIADREKTEALIHAIKPAKTKASKSQHKAEVL